MRLSPTFRRAWRIAGAALVALAIPAAQARAAPEWLEVARTTADPPAGPEVPGVVLYARTEMALDPHLKVRARQRIAIRIRDTSGLDLAAFPFQLEPGGRVREIHAWTLRPGFEAEARRGDVAETTLDPEHYTDVRRVIVRAPDARVGDVVAAELVSEESLPFPFYIWAPQARGLPLASTEFAVELPQGWHLVMRSADVTPQAPPPSGRTREYHLGPMPGLPPEENMPPLSLVLPRVMFRFVAPAGVQGFGDWKAIAAWYHDLAGPKFATEAAPAELTARAQSPDPLTCLTSLAREVQYAVTYAAIELGAQRWEPDAAADTWRRRYGDCKDKAVLLAAALEARGIHARPAMTCTRDRWSVDPEWPDPEQFNHCIVALAWPSGAGPAAATARGASGTAWTFFDPTATDVPLGLLPGALAGAWALVADPGEDLVRLPDASPDRLRCEVRAHLDGEGSIAGTLAIAGEGLACGWLVSSLERASEEDRRERVAELLEPGLRAEVETVRWVSTDSIHFVASLEADFHAAHAARRAGQAWLLPPVFRAVTWTSTQDSARTLPVWLGRTSAVERRLELALPPGFHVSDPPAVRWSGPLGTYELASETSDDRFVLTRRLEVRDVLVPAGRYQEVRGLMEAAHRGDATPLVLRPR